MIDLFDRRVPLAAPGIGDAPGNVDHPLIFSSGMSRRSDFLPALSVDHSIGVDVGELSEAATIEIAAALAASVAYLFVDSGAFALYRAKGRGKVGETDFAKVFARYDHLALAVSRADPSGFASARVFYVMPDVVGDQNASLAALLAWMDEATDYHASANGIVPLQSGAMSLIEYFDAACAILGRDDLTIGIPSAAEAVSNRELADLLAARPSIYGVHVLGAASAKRAGPRLAVLREAGFDGGVSLDANRLRSHWNDTCPTRKEALARLLAGLPMRKAA